MEIDPRIRSPFHDPDEAEQSYAGAAEPFGDVSYGICSEFRSSAGSTRTSFAGSPNTRGSSTLRRELSSLKLAMRVIHSSSS